MSEDVKEVKEAEVVEETPVEATIKTDGTKVTTLKLGNFSLSTPSFWITVICILCMFILMQIAINIHMYNRIMTRFLEHEERILGFVVKPQPTQQK